MIYILYDKMHYSYPFGQNNEIFQPFDSRICYFWVVSAHLKIAAAMSLCI